MKKYLRYIKEDIQEEEEYDDIEDLFHRIFSECTEYLDQVKGNKNLLWRGFNFIGDIDYEEVFNGPEGEYGALITPDDSRDPVDTPQVIHDTFDNILFDKFGWYPRSEAIFCFSKQGSAAHYGSTYMIFPKGKFEYVWSFDIMDFYMYLKKKYLRPEFLDFLSDYNFDGSERIKEEYYEDKIKDSYNSYYQKDERISLERFKEMVSQEYIEKILKDISEEYQNDDFKMWLNLDESREIMIKCDEYFTLYVDYEDMFRDKLKEYKNGN